MMTLLATFFADQAPRRKSATSNSGQSSAQPSKIHRNIGGAARSSMKSRVATKAAVEIAGQLHIISGGLGRRDNLPLSRVGEVGKGHPFMCGGRRSSARNGLTPTRLADTEADAGEVVLLARSGGHDP